MAGNNRRRGQSLSQSDRPYAMGLVLNYKVHGDGTIFNANQYPYPRHNLSENIVSAIFLDNRMRYYAISGDIWRFCPILRASAPFATPQIHGARIFSEPVDNEGTRRALSAHVQLRIGPMRATARPRTPLSAAYFDRNCTRGARSPRDGHCTLLEAMQTRTRSSWNAR